MLVQAIYNGIKLIGVIIFVREFQCGVESLGMDQLTKKNQAVPTNNYMAWKPPSHDVIDRVEAGTPNWPLSGLGSIDPSGLILGSFQHGSGRGSS